MTSLQTVPTPTMSMTDNTTATLLALTDALRSERRLLDELLAVMQRQRAAVAGDDLQSVEESVYATHRVLHTLNEARRRRRSLNRLLGEAEDLPIRELDDVLGARMTPELRSARDELEQVARFLSREVDINRRVLRQALAAGDDYVRAIYGSVEPKVGYARGPASAEAESRGGGLLLNRTA